MRYLAFLLVLGACDGGGTDTTDTTPVDTGPAPECNTDNEDCGVSRNCGGEGNNMTPGADCMQCHDGSNFEAPRWTLAGTVYDDLYGTTGVGGATVRVTDADGNVIEMTTASSGNFHTNRAFTFPIASAVIETGSGTIEMGDHPDTGACNSCHKCDGEAGGKLHAP